VDLSWRSSLKVSGSVLRRRVQNYSLDTSFVAFSIVTNFPDSSTLPAARNAPSRHIRCAFSPDFHFQLGRPRAVQAGERRRPFLVPSGETPNDSIAQLSPKLFLFSHRSSRGDGGMFRFPQRARFILSADSLGVVHRELMSRVVIEDSDQRNARLGCCV
jgi:hypothetical protein